MTVGFAYFIRRPRRFEDLFIPYSVDQETPYRIDRIVELNEMNYGNFITDFLVERAFLEAESLPVHGVCAACVLVRQSGSKDGVLIQPECGGRVAWAAYYTG